MDSIACVLVSLLLTMVTGRWENKKVSYLNIEEVKECPSQVGGPNPETWNQQESVLLISRDSSKNSAEWNTLVGLRKWEDP